MKSSLHNFRKGTIEQIAGPKPVNDNEAQLVICFGSKSMLSDESETKRISSKFPNADVVFCTTSGEIFNDSVVDNTIVATAIAFEKSSMKLAETNIADHANSYEAAQKLIQSLPKDELVNVMVIYDGNRVNGSELIKDRALT